MGFKCQSPNKTIHNIVLKEDNGAYIPAIIICNQKLSFELQVKPEAKDIPPPKGFIICGSMGLVKDPGCGPYEEPRVEIDGSFKTCVCDCDDIKASQACRDIGYDISNSELGGPCEDCICFGNGIYGPVELPDGSVVNRCHDNIFGACCDGLSCNQKKQENCVGKPFGLNLTCSEMSCTEECPSNEPLLTYICNTGFVNGNPVPIPFCVYCGTNQFFNPSTCSCEENCPTENMPTCSNGGLRDPNNCECCDGEYGWSPCAIKNNLYPDYPFEPEYLPGCPSCSQGGVTPAGSKSVWEESECSCKCVSPISCKQEAIDSADQIGIDPLLAENTNYTLHPITCECYCPSSSVEEDCNSKGLPFIPPSDIFGGCRCDCEQKNQNEFPSEQTCPANKWDPVRCECDCSDFPECTENKVRTDGCQCKCDPEIDTSCPDIQSEGGNGIPGGTRKGIFNTETCECDYPCSPEIEGGISAVPTTCEYQGDTYIVCTKCDDPNKVLGPCNYPIGGSRVCICADGTTPCGGFSTAPNDCCGPGEICVNGQCAPDCNGVTCSGQCTWDGTGGNEWDLIVPCSPTNCCKCDVPEYLWDNLGVTVNMPCFQY